jgi:hypothetical protein
MKMYKKLLALAVLTLVSAEMAPRILGMVDFPIYAVDDRTGYIPAPSQSGSFLNKNEWFVNSQSMASREEFTPTTEKNDILLIGDSVVWGGNAYLWSDRLSEQMKRVTDANVWSVSAGSWAIVNEVNYLEDHADVVSAVDQIILVVNEADFATPSSWRNEFTHPRSKPKSAFIYLVRKYFVKPKAAPTPRNLIVEAESPLEKLGAFTAQCNCEIDVWVWPTKKEVSGSAPDTLSTEEMVQQLTSVIPLEQIHQVSAINGWSTDLYKDSIHPNEKGMSIFASAILDELSQINE